MYTIYDKDGLTVESRFARSEKYAWIQPDSWGPGGWSLFDGDAFDKSYFGPDTLRIETGQEIIPSLAVRVTVTGHKVIRYDNNGRAGYRCKIEFIGDGDPSTYTGGVVYLK